MPARQKGLARFMHHHAPRGLAYPSSNANPGLALGVARYWPQLMPLSAVTVINDRTTSLRDPDDTEFLPRSYFLGLARSRQEEKRTTRAR